MKIIGFAISKVSAERKNPSKGKVEIQSGIDIKNIEKEEIFISTNPGLKFEFEYTVNYNPDLANIIILGHIIAIDDKNESEAILKEWKKKKFTNPVKLPLFNFILDKCNLKALQLEEELGLIKHIPLPKLTIKQEESNSNPVNYTG